MKVRVLVAISAMLVLTTIAGCASAGGQTLPASATSTAGAPGAAAPEGAMTDDKMAEDGSMAASDGMKASDSAMTAAGAKPDPAAATKPTAATPVSEMVAGSAPNKPDAAMAGTATATDSGMNKGQAAPVAESPSRPEDRYVAYSLDALAKASRDGARAVLFFKASWCPTCRAADAEYRANLAKIPPDVTVLLVDYDRESDLKRQYGVTYQHTFVQVDASGKQVTRWSGGAVEELLANVR